MGKLPRKCPLGVQEGDTMNIKVDLIDRSYDGGELSQDSAH
jgi:hypothetical protein